MATLSLIPPYHGVRGENRVPVLCSQHYGGSIFLFDTVLPSSSQVLRVTIGDRSDLVLLEKSTGLVPMLRILLLPDGHDHVSMIVVHPQREI